MELLELEQQKEAAMKKTLDRIERVKQIREYD